MRMEKKLPRIPYGISNFETIGTENHLYVDKAHFIENVGRMRMLIHLRPRRFGESLWMSRLKSDDMYPGQLNLRCYLSLSIRWPIIISILILRFNFSGVQSVNVGDVASGFLRSLQVFSI